MTVPGGRLDFELCVSSGQVFRWERQPDGSWLGVDGDHWYRVREAVPVPRLSERRELDALAYVAETRAACLPRVDHRFLVESNGTSADFESLFRLDWDADRIEAEILRLAPEMAPYLGALGGLRLLRPSGAVETFFCFLCTPNNNLARITQMVRKLATYGPVLDTLEGRPLHRFPNVETIAALPEQELRSAAFGYRAATIPSVARQVLERGGEPWIEHLKAVPYVKAHEELIDLKGVGHKLADCIALFALHHTSAVPIDTHLWQALTRLYFPEWKGKTLTDQKYRQASEFMRSKFGELTGWAHQYLFYDNVLNWRTRRGGER